MNLHLTKPIKAETRLRPTSGGWIPPTETGHSFADQSGFTLVEAVIAMFDNADRGAGFGEFVFGSRC